MALIVQSRFAGLKVEDDDYPPSPKAQKAKKAKATVAKKPEPKIKTIITTGKPQNVAPVQKKKKVKHNMASPEQWEEWKQKDEELANGNFESELQQAILLSKLDFEEKKDVYKLLKRETELARKEELAKKAAAQQQSRSAAKKAKKKPAISLEEFNMILCNGDDPRYYHNSQAVMENLIAQPHPDPGYFARVEAEAKSERHRDKIIDIVRRRKPLSDDIINRVQFAEALQRKDKEIEELKQQVNGLNEELLKVKSRNMKLCKILGHGEMKDKAEVLEEVERLRLVQTELTSEIENLHTELEKERSRNTDARSKDKKNSCRKKSIRFDVSSEALASREPST